MAAGRATQQKRRRPKRGNDEKMQFERPALRDFSDKKLPEVGVHQVAWKRLEKFCVAHVTGDALQRRKTHEISDSAPPSHGVADLRKFCCGLLNTVSPGVPIRSHQSLRTAERLLKPLFKSSCAARRCLHGPGTSGRQQLLHGRRGRNKENHHIAYRDNFGGREKASLTTSKIANESTMCLRSESAVQRKTPLRRSYTHGIYSAVPDVKERPV